MYLGSTSNYLCRKDTKVSVSGGEGGKEGGVEGEEWGGG